MLRSALKQLSVQRKQLDRQIAALTEAVGDGLNRGARMIGLSNGGDRGAKTATATVKAAAKQARKPRKKMSAAQRAAVGKRMKTYWKKRRDAKPK